MHTQTEIVSRCEKAPQNFSRKTQVRASAIPKFCDAAYWDELAAKHLSRYDLPHWGVPCDPIAMERWLDRLDIAARDYFYMAGLKSLQEFIDLNPSWPLRAFIGLALEMKNEGGFR